MPANRDLTLVDEAEAQWTYERLELHRRIDLEHVMLLVLGDLLAIRRLAARRAINLIKITSLHLLDLLLLRKHLHGDGSLQIDVSLHDILLFEDLVERAKLPISLNDSLRAILVHRLQGRRVWRLVGLVIASGALAILLLRPVNFLCSLRLRLLGGCLSTGGLMLTARSSSFHSADDHGLWSELQAPLPRRCLVHIAGGHLCIILIQGIPLDHSLQNRLALVVVPIP